MISVITVCYNSGKTIRKTLESMLSQTYSDFEYIIVDGGSTDDTISIIEEYIPKFQGKINYVSEKDNGVYDAMNKGIARSNGELIGILNSDDYYERDTLEKVYHALTGARYEVVYGMQRSLINEMEYQIIFTHHSFLEQQMITHPTCFVTKETYDDLGIFDAENYRSSADYELMLRYYRSGEVKFTPVYSVLSNFALGGISSSNVGVVETAKLKYSLGLISRKKYIFTRVKAWLSDILGNR